MKQIITIVALTLTFSVFAQMEDGKYSFSNNELSLNIEISDGGQTISKAVIKNLTTSKEESLKAGTGVFTSANDIEWYQFETTECHYEFDFKYGVPMDKLTLKISSCKNGKANKNIVLLKGGNTATAKTKEEGSKNTKENESGTFYDKWKAELSKYETQNPAPNNPGAIAKKFVEQGKIGNGKAVALLCEDKVANKARNQDHGIHGLLDELEDFGKKNTPDGAKNEIGKLFLTMFATNKGPFKPLVWYTDANSASVAYYYGGGHQLWYVNLIKIGGKWKIVELNDHPNKAPSNYYNSFGCTSEYSFAEKFVNVRMKELNP